MNIESNHDQTPNPASSIDPRAQAFLDRIKNRLSQAQDRLVDRNLRNKLVNTALNNSKSKNIRVWDELSEQVFDCLYTQKKEMTFGHNEKIVEDADSIESQDLVDRSDEDDVELNPDRHTDTVLATKLSKLGLERKLRVLFYESTEYEEEQGVNILYLALGFVKWYEDTNSEIERFAPLILLPVQLTREGAKERYKIQIRDEDLMTNVSLKLWLKEQHSMDLPDLPEEDNWKPSEYFDAVRSAISKSSKWEVIDNEILLGFFSFSKFLLWRDLDPDNWPKGAGILENHVIKKLLGSSTDSEPVMPEPALIPENELIDDHFTPHDLVYVLDADSSQTEAIQTTLAGRDLVIQGPPGTGKSQTITNIIAAAVHQGKKVLFVAEKMAALEVVHQRLVKSGLGPLCFELLSRKSSKSAVLNQLRQSIELPNQPKTSEELLNQLQDTQDVLNKHTKRLNSIEDHWGMAPFEVLGQISLLTRQGVQPSSYIIPNAGLLNRTKVDQIVAELKELVSRLEVTGVPTRHPWCASTGGPTTPLDSERLQSVLEQYLNLLHEVVHICSNLDEEAGVGLDFKNALTLNNLHEIVSAFEMCKKAPELDKVLLTSHGLQERLGQLESLQAQLHELNDDAIELGKTFLPGWESKDLLSIRGVLAESGGSLFSVFNSKYRTAKATFQKITNVNAPKGVKDMLASLDKAQASIKLSSDVLATSAELIKELGVVWDGPKTNAQTIATLIDWYKLTLTTSGSVYSIVTKILVDTVSLSYASSIESKINKINELRLQIIELGSIPLDSFAASDIQKEIVKIGDLLNGVSRFNEWPVVRDLLKQLSGTVGDRIVADIYEGLINTDDIVNRVKITIYEQIWRQMASKLPKLATLDGHQLDTHLSKFRGLDKKRMELAAHQVLSSYASNRPGGYAGDMAVIRQELGKKRNHMPVRKLIAKAGRAIQELKPIFLMSPMSVAQYLQPGQMTFDLILIDEASQIRPEDSLGAIARAKQLVVVGDDKQLPPTNFFSGLANDIEDTDFDDDGLELGSLESILSLCNIVLPNQSMLRWHYRSHHPGLIAVSNRNFYDNNLLLPPSTLRESYADGMGVSMVKSPANSYERGGANGGRNIVEAEMIAGAVIEFAQKYPNKSLGVAAFSVKQRDAIRDLVDNHRRKHPELEPFFSDARDEPFFIKNLESIQGDQRDVIFISVGYGRDTTGRLTQTFGPLGQDGGERRLNVLISRAKDRCTVFSSITADDVRPSPGNLGVNAFREFLQYAEKGYFDVPMLTGGDFDSPFEESVADFLIQNGYQVQPQVGMAGFFIDLGVIDRDNPNRFMCGVECDGATYHSSRSARDRDRLRQEILESRGWNIFRIWSTDWFHRRAIQEQKLLNYLGGLSKGLQPAKTDMPVVDVPKFQPPEVEAGVKKAPVAKYREFAEDFSTNKLPHELPVTQMSLYVTRIVEVEGPIHQDEVGRRVAKCFGLERSGSRIQSAVLAGLKHAKLSTNGLFWDLPSNTATPRDRSNVASRTLLQAGSLPPAEILAGLQLLINQNVRMNEDELIQQTSRLFGFSRCGPDLKSAIKAVLECETDHFHKVEDGAYLKKPQD